VGLIRATPQYATARALESRDAVREIENRRRQWWDKRLLRSAYANAWQELAAFAAPGPSLEIGCGCGNLDGVLPHYWKSDIVALPWADLVADAMRLPFRSGTLSNIVGTDVLHHLPRPLDFFMEAARALRPDGRVLLLEPYMSWVSYPLFRYLHPERADLRRDPFDCAHGEPAAAASVNQAAATLLFCRNRDTLAQQVAQLEVIHCRPRDAIAYPLSGGYSFPALVPGFAEAWAWRLEGLLGPWMPFIGFRLAVALRRKEGA